jgi:hypothetical protein
MKLNSTSLPRWGKFAAGGTMLAIAVAAGGLGLTLNVQHGLETSLAAGVAFDLADATKVVLPVVCGGVIGWTKQLRITALVCVLASLWAASNAYLDAAGRDLLAKEHGAQTYAANGRQVAELEAEVASLRDLAAEEGARGGCKQACRTLLVQADDAAKRLQNARTVQASSKPVEVSGLAVAMARGGSAERIAHGVGVIKALIFLVLLEALVWLSVPAMMLLASALKKAEPAAKKATKARGKAKTVATAKRVAKAEPGRLLPAPTLRLGGMTRRPIDVAA